MKDIKQFTIIFTMILVLVSCKKSTTPTPSTPKEFLEVTIDGQKIRQEKDFGINVGTGLGGLNLCDGKTGFLAYHTTATNSRFDLNANLIHYRNQSDFVNSKAGSFQITDDYYISVFNGVKICNLGLEVKLEDNSGISKVISNQKHTVTSITKHSENNTYVQYIVEGTFSGNYRNTSNATYPVSGSYRVLIEVVK